MQNKDLIRRLERELRSRSVRPTLVYVKGHAGIYGNEMADRYVFPLCIILHCEAFGLT